MQETWGYNHTHHHLFLAQPPRVGEEGRGAKDRTTFSWVPKATQTPPKSLSLTSSLGLICKDLARAKTCQAFDKTAGERNQGFKSIAKVGLTFGRCCGHCNSKESKLTSREKFYLPDKTLLLQVFLCKTLEIQELKK